MKRVLFGGFVILGLAGFIFVQKNLFSTTTNSSLVVHSLEVVPTTTESNMDESSDSILAPGIVVSDSVAASLAASSSVSVVVFGDMMLDRTVRTIIGKVGVASLFDFVKPWISDADIALANAEGVFTNNSSIAQKNHDILRFTFDPATLPILKDVGFDFLSQANNHNADFDRKGIATSRTAIEQSGMVPVGDYYNDRPGPVYRTVGSTTVAFVAYNQFSYQHLDEVRDAIVKAKTFNTFVVVFPHWGEEYMHIPTDLQQKIAHSFIDSGADVVIGAHPHVIESIEQYKNKLIFYSLGNFIFDQHFSPDVMEGFAVHMDIEPTQVTYRLLPYSINASQPKPMNDHDAALMIHDLQVYSARTGFRGVADTMVIPR